MFRENKNKGEPSCFMSLKRNFLYYEKSKAYIIFMRIVIIHEPIFVVYLRAFLRAKLSCVQAILRVPFCAYNFGAYNIVCMPFFFYSFFGVFRFVRSVL